MQISRWIDKTKIDKHGAAPIMLTITYQGQRSRYYTKYKVEPKYWNEAKEIVKNSFDFAEAFNRKLDDWDLIIKLAWNELETPYAKVEKQKFEELIENLWKTWDKLKGKTSGDLALEQKHLLEETKNALYAPISFFDFWDIYLSDHKTKFSPNYYASFKSPRKHLLGYRPDITYADFTLRFFNQYINYLADEKDYADATITLYVNKIIYVLEYAAATGMTIPQDHLLIKFKHLEADRVFLSWEEIMHLNSFSFEPAERLRVDQFLFACFTGFRYSDLIRLDVALGKSKDVPVFRLHQQKTKEKVTVAMNDYAQEVWDRHAGTLFAKQNLINSERFNEVIKILTRKAGLETITKITEFKKGQIVESFVPKWKAITSHTGRHSFAVNSLEKGMPLEVLQKILGHKSISSTQVYAKIVDEFKHKTMVEVWKKPIQVVA